MPRIFFRKSASTLLVLTMLSLPLSAAQARRVEAEVGAPVLEELMGGCSLACAFPWSVESVRKGAKAKPLPELSDERARGAWTEPARGARLNFVLPKKLPPELERTPVYGFNIINGFWSDEQTWSRYARIKRARLLYNERPFAEISLADTRRWQEVFFGDIFVRSGDRMVLEILEFYPGSGAKERETVAVSEISLQGGH